MKTCAIAILLKERIIYLKNLEKDMREKLSSLPADKLHTMKSGNRILYYTRNGTTRKYISKADTELLRKLETKEYYAKIVKSAEKEQQLINKVLKILEKSPDTDSVFTTINAEQKNLIEPYIQNLNKKELEKWKNDYMTHRNIADNSNLLTKAGTRVRSKSELIIAERFETYGIPYKYECAIFVGDKDVWFPDFTVLNKRTGKQFIWEHFGMMDNPDYCASAQYKIEKYAKEGFIQGKNLIITTESSLHSLNTKYIDSIIEKILL